MCNHHRNPLHCIMPPYMTDKLNDLLGVPEKEQDNDNFFRNKRSALAAMPRPKNQEVFRIAAKVSKTRLYREVYDAHQGPRTIGGLVWKEGQQSVPDDADVKNVIEGAGNVWSFYKRLFKRNSIDNKGMAIIQTVRFREMPLKPFFNAFWDGEQMFYGTGMPQYTNSFTSDLDIIAHELTHGIIDHECAFAYENQSGALNESFADVFGILVKQWTNKTAARDSDWLIGSNILKGKNALRSMAAPGTAYKSDPVYGNDPQPAHMKQFVQLPNTEAGDNGGVHYNSGIPNHAFYIAAVEMGGNAWETIGPVWYAAMTDQKAVKKNTDFAKLAAVTIKKSATLFGKGSLVEKAVARGWKDTGVI